MINRIIAEELNIKLQQVEATVALLTEGATVPFIARYRKERTGGLTDTQLRTLEERLTYLRELENRRDVIMTSIDEQGKLTPTLSKAIHAATTKARLEDLYLPYKPKRRTKAQIAIEAGLEPLAALLLSKSTDAVDTLAADFINPEHNIQTTADALEGAQFIIMERLAENADLLKALRDYVWAHGMLTSVVVKNKKTEGEKFTDYFDYAEALSKVPSHRSLAVFRGQKEGILRVTIAFPNDTHHDRCVQMVARAADVQITPSLFQQWLGQTLTLAWKVKLKLKIDVDSLVRLREQAEVDAMAVFKTNLHHLLMAAPAGRKITLGLDPGFRTGVKTVVLDDTGKLLAHTVIYPHAPQNQWDKALHTLAKLCEQHGVTLVSIGNGTASRETEKLVHALIKQYPTVTLMPVVVSEAGASVYSASELAAKEFPTLDVSYRGAISIARRLQDPLAELVKIDPKAIGVGQYQHDVNQTILGKSLHAVVEDCVNAVGADVNTASVPLLTSIAGLNETVAQNIVAYRESHGRFVNRKAIKKVPRLGEKTYEQAIGFLRIIDGKVPLDASAVHPEAYGIVDQILARNSITIKQLMGNANVLTQLTPGDYVSDAFGVSTVCDIIEELKKPGRDPRPAFKTATFKEGVNTLSDLTEGMQLEGTVTNVTNFGAFVDIGVHQDGLVHISELADTFVSDPNTIVSVGQVVKVQVKSVDEARKRIQLTMKKGKPARAGSLKQKASVTIEHGFSRSLKEALR